ncbi:MAG TPA: dihydrofolate reductase family protein [Candidatus Baltobacteraceae bacterium]|nr:dihydrofolate reductase family protein [Candidatus Baltobacteraceae bacterium]
MGKIVVSENVTLDGIVQDPTGEEGLDGGGWFGRVGEKNIEAWGKIAYDEARHAEALLFGRRSYEWFAKKWTSRSGEFADRLATLPKYVVSSTMEDPRWNNSTVLKGDVVSQVSKLKQSREGEIVLYASSQLVHALLKHDLVDELRLTIYPFVIGVGERLFGATSDTTSLRLVETRNIGDSLVYLRYDIAR